MNTTDLEFRLLNDFQRGFPLVRSFEFTLIITLAQLPGYAAAAWLIEKWGRRSTLATFLLGSPQIRKIFLRHHKDLLTPIFWQSAQEKIRAGQLEDFFPYPETLRFNQYSADSKKPA